VSIWFFEKLLCGSRERRKYFFWGVTADKILYMNSTLYILCTVQLSMYTNVVANISDQEGVTQIESATPSDIFKKFIKI
jgi:hypothetical protein